MTWRDRGAVARVKSENRFQRDCRPCTNVWITTSRWMFVFRVSRKFWLWKEREEDGWGHVTRERRRFRHACNFSSRKIAHVSGNIYIYILPVIARVSYSFFETFFPKNTFFRTTMTRILSMRTRHLTWTGPGITHCAILNADGSRRFLLRRRPCQPPGRGGKKEFYNTPVPEWRDMWLVNRNFVFFSPRQYRQTQLNYLKSSFRSALNSKTALLDWYP